MRTSFLVPLIFASVASAADWPAWRGLRGDGISDEADVPTRWSKTENVAWTAPIPGKGHSSPIVFGDRVFVTTCLEEEQRHVLVCLDRLTGRQLWEQSTPARLQEKIHRRNSHASSTPATDGKLVWVSFLDDTAMTLVAYDFDSGKEVWRVIPGKMLSKHGYCSSVIPFQKTIVINSDQDGDGYIVALDGASGKERWRTPRPNNTRSYCAPIIIEVKGKKQLVLSGSLSVAAYAPESGKPIWIVDGPTEQFVSSPVYVGGVVFMTYGFPKRGICGIDPTGEGNVTATHMVFNLERMSRGGYVPSPVVHGERAFVVNDEGIATCSNPRTGDEIWLERLGRSHNASPVTAGGNVYFIDDLGLCRVVRAGDKYEVVSQNDLADEVRASPAIARGQIFIRGSKQLYCIGKK